MFNWKRIGLAIVVAIAVTLGLALLGAILTSGSAATDPTALLPTIGRWLEHYGALIGILCGLWFYLTGANRV